MLPPSTDAIAIADSPWHRSGVDSFIEFDVTPGHEYAVLVGDLDESSTDDVRPGQTELILLTKTVIFTERIRYAG